MNLSVATSVEARKPVGKYFVIAFPYVKMEMSPLSEWENSRELDVFGFFSHRGG
jgi:hypothetical protein